ncbi:murein transglycosylase A [Amantichitinum ursilacus]|uniref:peptidoglycan lytic exotransglycosylase n=1 Tax=Amantichitinum ursilacus TaxID=857265 RepID=A0A0N0GR95_9NEIS|nr:MltA domain-containing protein [Amantichitinum ursilacus]KPC55448.1 Membrane-bound lytic murein transglycosylase A precursor [Amantichitinum ursilacus]
MPAVLTKSLPGWCIVALAGLLILAGCATPPATPPTPTPTPTEPTKPAPLTYQPGNWTDLPAASDADLVNGFAAWRNGCSKLARNEVWSAPCKAAAEVSLDAVSVRAFMQANLQPYALQNPDGSQNGLITGYYEPIYPGSLTRTAKAVVPVYAVPDDLITVQLDDVYPELKGKRLRGRLQGKKLVAYPDAAAIGASGLNTAPVLAWLENPMDLQFLQIQGSGRVRLADGSQLRLAYADQNGRPFKPIGRWLIEQKELKSGEVSMQAIRGWAQQHPDRINQMLGSNPSYVFFRTLPPANEGPQGALAVPLTAGYSVAIDPKAVPLGSMLWLATTRPDTGAALQGPMAAQDTGGAINGNVRADLFWGTGDAAGEVAGKTKQSGKIWLLWPKGAALPLAPSVN